MATRKKKRRRPGGAKVQTGQYKTEAVVKDNVTKEELGRSRKEGRFLGLLDQYQEMANKAGVSVDTIMRTLPRGSLSLGSTFSEDYKSVTVRAGLEMTFPDFDNPTAKAMYEQMAAKMEYVLAEAMEEAREAAGI